MVRKGWASLGLIGLVALVLPAAAVAGPTVTLVAKAAPIPGFPGTGNFLGGETVTTTYKAPCPKKK
jgi:hypothetical protein